jgi:hypothetical protein
LTAPISSKNRFLDVSERDRCLFSPLDVHNLVDKHGKVDRHLLKIVVTFVRHHIQSRLAHMNDLLLAKRVIIKFFLGQVFRRNRPHEDVHFLRGRFGEQILDFVSEIFPFNLWLSPIIESF